MSRPGRKKEKKDAKDFGARETPRSGGFWGFKGDEVTDKLLIESKETKKKRFCITEELWEKTYEQALISGKIPILSIELGNKKEIVVLSKEDFIELWQRLQNLEHERRVAIQYD